MPRYDFYCTQCNWEVEITRSFTDDKEILCDTCLIPLTKRIAATPVHFRGTGFYSTDK
jgi:putative FmdB family regulatory protein